MQKSQFGGLCNYCVRQKWGHATVQAVIHLEKLIKKDLKTECKTEKDCYIVIMILKLATHTCLKLKCHHCYLKHKYLFLIWMARICPWLNLPSKCCLHLKTKFNVPIFKLLSGNLSFYLGRWFIKKYNMYLNFN